MPLKFTKMHALGNDYVYVSIFDQEVPNPVALAQTISDRHLGVGSDGLILVGPPDNPDAHVRMDMYNADGSWAEMCGNGVRCVAKLAYERGWARVNPIRVQSERSVVPLTLTIDDNDRVIAACVDLGEPILDPARIPVTAPGDQVVSHPIQVEGDTLAMTCVSVGNPHAVFFERDLRRVPLAQWGPQLERHPCFPERVNVHFAQVRRADFVGMITWERGSGITRACGTGACAVCVAGVLNNLTDRRVTVRLPGGQLIVEWEEATNHVLLTGPAEEVFTGEWPQ